MSKMAELHYEREQIREQEDYPSIEYDMLYPEKRQYTPRLDTWYNKKYANPKDYKPNWTHYIKAQKVECPF